MTANSLVISAGASAGSDDVPIGEAVIDTAEATVSGSLFARIVRFVRGNTSVAAGGQVSATATADVAGTRFSVDGLFNADGALTVNVSELQTGTSGFLQSGGDAALVVTGNTLNQGQILSAANLSLQSASLENALGGAIATLRLSGGPPQGDLTLLISGHLNNQGDIAADGIDLRAASLVTGASSQIAGGDDVAVRVTGQTTHAGSLGADGRLLLQTGGLQTLTGSQILADEINLTANTVHNSGDIAAHLSLAVNAGQFTNTRSSELVAGRLLSGLAAGDQGALSLNVTGAALNEGIISALGDATISAGSWQQASRGVLQSADLTLAYQTHADLNGQTHANGDLTLNRAGGPNASTSLTIPGTVTAAGFLTLGPNSGVLISGMVGAGQLAAQNSVMNTGTIRVIDDADFTSLQNSGVVDIGGLARIAGTFNNATTFNAGAVHLTGNLAQNSGAITVVGGVLMDGAGPNTFRNTGRISAGQFVTLLNLSAFENSGAAAVIRADDIVISSGAAGAFAFTQSGQIDARDQVLIEAAGGHIQNSGRIHANGSVNIGASTISNLAGAQLSGGSVFVFADRVAQTYTDVTNPSVYVPGSAGTRRHRRNRWRNRRNRRDGWNRRRWWRWRRWARRPRSRFVPCVLCLQQFRFGQCQRR